MDRILYLDCTYGITEQGMLGALLHLGADLAYINRFIKELPFGSFTFERQNVETNGVLAAKAHLHDVPLKEENEQSKASKAADILRLIQSSEIPAHVKERSLLVIKALTEANSRLKGMPVEKSSMNGTWTSQAVHIIGICLGLESLGIKQIYASPILIGAGIQRTEDGMTIIPNPIVYELLKGIPITEVNAVQNLTTPLGAALIQSLAGEVASHNCMTIERSGYGGSDDVGKIPSILRASIVKFNDPIKTNQSKEAEESIFVLEFQVDDMAGEGLGFLMEELFDAGALDVFYTPVYMKKNRPGILVTVLSSLKNTEFCEEVILTETTTLGVRKSVWSRRILERNIVYVDTCYGRLRLKQAIKDGKVLRQIPEYEDVKKAAKDFNVPFHEVYTMALAKSQDEKA
ncbi:uncharacterized protein (TIGR00299 family) protein [Peribacillus deserti]|uniref:Uncharacterized protein (TIGR00299 family) protein n=1 Tax=Peribacillus deserti TaxID=673318 RepID=A0ABS2QGZ0_9BACI|nr:LarC family nickel insertion protein [Peribacillus deserti]MBM7691526.1 uncharacterized protein (TIGR00299 family) protein [Peribacillus deserti]